MLTDVVKIAKLEQYRDTLAEIKRLSTMYTAINKDKLPVTAQALKNSIEVGLQLAKMLKHKYETHIPLS